MGGAAFLLDLLPPSHPLCLLLGWFPVPHWIQTSALIILFGPMCIWGRSMGPYLWTKKRGVMSWNFLKLGICDGPQGGSWCPNQHDRNILWYWPVESGHTNRVPTDLLYVEMGGGGFLRCAMKATLIDVKANVENFFQIKAHLKTFQFSVCHHIWGHYE